MILLLAGTAEARELAQALADAGIAGEASLAGAVRRPLPLALPVRVGGFGGADGFTAYLRDRRISAVIDATHPFARRITPRTRAICRELGVPYLRLERPGWTAEPGDDWRWIDSEAEAQDHLPPGAVAFLATGRLSLANYGPLPGRVLHLRVIDPPTAVFPLAGGWITGRPPFTLADELALFTRLRITHLVSKDSGGAENRAKLEAARRLGLPVLMIRRPPPVPGQIARIEEAVAWARRV